MYEVYFYSHNENGGMSMKRMYMENIKGGFLYDTEDASNDPITWISSQHDQIDKGIEVLFPNTGYLYSTNVGFDAIRELVIKKYAHKVAEARTELNFRTYELSNIKRAFCTETKEAN